MLRFAYRFRRRRRRHCTTKRGTMGGRLRKGRVTYNKPAAYSTESSLNAKHGWSVTFACPPGFLNENQRHGNIKPLPFAYLKIESTIHLANNIRHTNGMSFKCTANWPDTVLHFYIQFDEYKRRFL